LRAELAGAGVVAGPPLALVFPDGPEFALALLAASAFGACAPLEPAASQEEFLGLFSHLRAATLLTLDGLYPNAIRAAEVLGMNVARVNVRPNGDPAAIRCSRGASPRFVPRAIDASILLFTSSTTGRPKLVPHGCTNLEAAFRNESRALALTGEDRLLNLTPLANARGLRALLVQLFLGGSGILVPRLAPEKFPQWLKEFQPTWISLAAAGLGVLRSQASRLPELWRSTGVRFIRSGGTAPDPQLVREVEGLTGVPVLNGYGTTESGGITRMCAGAGKPGSTGRTTGTAIAILDEAGNALQPGKPGEIAIRGDNLTPGYVDDDEANRRAFRNGWFHTGDLGYLDGDGFLYLTGRLAEVINRGGQKIIPQQVEEMLRRHPMVRDAAVFGVPHKTLGEDVVALLVAAEPVPEIEIRQFATANLSAYKAPNRILFIDSLPRNAAGKLQRKRLSEEYSALLGQPQDALQVLPTRTERALAAIWEDEFQRIPAGPDSDFFSMGGDSLSAVTVVARIQSTFGISLDLPELMEYPKLRDLARVVDEFQRGERKRIVAQRSRPKDEHLPLSFAQERIWKYLFLEGKLSAPCPVHYNMAFAHLLRGLLDPELLRRGMRHMAARHEILRTTFEVAGGLPVQVVHASADVDLEVRDLSSEPDPAAHADRALEEEAARPFDLQRGPLVRFVLVRLSTQEHRLLRICHHLISDAHSWEIYFRELGAIYQKLLSGDDPGPSQPATGYGDYALWQRREFDPGLAGVRKSVEWWAAQFSRPSKPPRVPFHDAVNRMASAERHEDLSPGQGLLKWGIEREVTARLAEYQRTEGVSHYRIHLAAFAAVVAELTGTWDVTIGSYFSSRNRVEWRNVMGDCSNLVALRVAIEKQQTFREAARAVNVQVKDAYLHGELPFELLSAELRKRGVAMPQVSIIFDTASHTAPIQLGAAEASWIGRAAPAMPWGFSLLVDRHNEDRLCYAAFDARVYQPEAVRAVLNRLTRFLKAASMHPGLTLGRLLEISR
jgi:acyl-CoA synthetase (AMP-forming)/AMP-acid ligase II/acyl carrier protein